MFAKLLSDGRQPQLLLRPVRGLLQRARAHPSSCFCVEGDQVGDDVVVQRRQKRRRRRQGKASELGDSCLKNFGYEIFFIVRPMLQWSNLVTTMSWVRIHLYFFLSAAIGQRPKELLELLFLFFSICLISSLKGI